MSVSYWDQYTIKPLMNDDWATVVLLVLTGLMVPVGDVSLTSEHRPFCRSTNQQYLTVPDKLVSSFCFTKRTQHQTMMDDIMVPVGHSPNAASLREASDFTRLRYM